MDPKYLTHMIDNSDDGLKGEFDIFMDELENLSNDQLRQLLPLVKISFGGNSTISRDDMINLMDETTWEKFFAAYKKVTGRHFVLDVAQ